MISTQHLQQQDLRHLHFFSGRPILIDSMSSGDMLNVVSKLSTVEEDTRALGLFSLQADTGRIFSGICCN